MDSFPITPVLISGAVFLVLLVILAAATVVVKKKSQGSIVSLLVGMGIFAVCYVIAIATQILFGLFVTNTIVLILILSLRAGVVEELGRYIAFRFFLKRQERVGDALLYGLGHGGMEVVLIIGLSVVNAATIWFMINSGMWNLLTGGLDAEGIALLEAQLSSVQTQEVSMYVIGGVERISAIIVHVSLSVIVFCSVRQRKPLYLVLSIFLHFALDATICLYASGLVNMFVLEAILAALALLYAGIAFVFARRYIKWYNEQLPRIQILQAPPEAFQTAAQPSSLPLDQP